MSLYRRYISHIVEVKYIPIAFLHFYPKNQGLGFPRIGIEHTITLIYFFSKHIYSHYLSAKGVILSLRYMQLEVGSMTQLISLIYVNYAGLLINSWISIYGK